MARSLKKWFYIQEKLLKKIQTMVASGDKKVIKIDNLIISSYKTVHGVMRNCYGYVFKYNDKIQFFPILY